MRDDCIAKAILINKAGHILLLKRSETDIRRPNQWDLPGGHVDENESAQQAVIREIEEEAGVQASVRHLIFAKTEYVEWNDTVTKTSNVTWMYFSCSAPSEDVTLSNEHSDYCWVSIDKAIEIVEYSRHLEVLRHVRDNQLEI